MRRTTAFALLALALTPLTRAQNEFLIYPERNGSAATYTTRVEFTSVRIECLKEIPGGLFAGLGDGGSTSEVIGMFAWMTDEDSTTAEQYELVIRAEAPGGGPDATAAGEILRVGPFSTPTANPSRRLTHIARHTFPPFALPRTGTLFFGIDLHAVNNWTQDGHGLWGAYYNPPPARATHGDNPRQNAPNLTWSVSNGVARQSPNPMTLRIGLILTAPVLNVGNNDPNNVRQTPPGSSNYGAAGLFPVTMVPPARNDGHDLRFEDRARAGGTAAGFLALGITPIGPIPFVGIQGNLWLDPRFVFAVPPVTIDPATGVATVTVFPPGSVPVAAVGGRVFYQGVTVSGPAGAAFTNVQGIDF